MMMMATYIMIIITFVLLMAEFFQSTNSSYMPPLMDHQDDDLGVAIKEMQKANYFTFVMLINMRSPLDRKLVGNVTFLMPNDRMLSKMIIPENGVSGFLHRHSIPSPLLFEHLQHIPTGSILPSNSMPEFMLSVSNGGGRRNFFLNNVRIISPNICTAGTSIRCHGVDGVLISEANSPGNNVSSPTCSNNTGAVAASSASPMASPTSTVPLLPFPGDEFPVLAPQPADDSSSSSSKRNSGSSQFVSCKKLLKFVGILLVVSMINGVSI